MMTVYEPLPQAFYLQETVLVAQALLGKIVVRRLSDGRTLTGRVVETEAYAQDDPAMYAYRTPNRVNETMFGPPGHAFCYLTYRVHLMFNVVCAPQGVAESVLIRAIEPLEGMAQMATNRGIAADAQDLRTLTNGPGKLTVALGLSVGDNGYDLTDPNSELLIIDGPETLDGIVTTTRIGLSRGSDLPRRFYLQGNPYVSRR